MLTDTGQAGRRTVGWLSGIAALVACSLSLAHCTSHSHYCRRVGDGECSSLAPFWPPGSAPPIVSMGTVVKNRWLTSYNPASLLPAGRANHAATVILLNVDNQTVEETMLVFGGVSDRDDFASQTWLYQPIRNAWLMLQVEQLTPRFGHSLITGPSGEYALLLGGCPVVPQAEQLGQYIFFNMSWHELPFNRSVFPSRFLHSTVILPHYHSQSYKVNLQRDLHSSGPATTERRVFIFGGSVCDVREGLETDDLWLLHYDSSDFPGVSGIADVLQWFKVSVTGVKPLPRAGHVGVSTPYDSMLVFSGFYNSSVLTDLWEFYYVEQKFDWVWRQLPGLPLSAKSMHSCYSVVGMYLDLEDALVVAFTCSSNATLSLWSYLYVNKTWEYLQPVGIQEPPLLAFPSMAIVDQQLLVFGGRTPYGLSSVDVWAFVKRTGFSMWAVQPQPASIPMPRSLHTAAFCPALGMMYVIGGFRIDVEPTSTLQSALLADNNLWQWNSSFDRWTQQPVPSAFKQRMASAAQILGGFLVIFGGIDANSQSLNDTWLMDTTSLVWRRSGGAIAPVGRGAHTMVTYKHYAVVFGGLVVASGELLRDVWYYDISEGSWEQQKRCGRSQDIPPRFGHGAAVVDHYMYVHGGVAKASFDAQDNKLWRYDLRNHLWEIVAGDTMATMYPEPRFFASLTAVGKKLVLLGGCTAYSSITLVPDTWYTQLPVFCWSRQKKLNVAFVYDTTVISNYRGQWAWSLSMQNPPPMYMQHTAVTLAGSLIVYGGIGYQYLYNESSGAGMRWEIPVGCAAGFFSSSFADASCQPCPIASYSKEAGQAACRRCPNNTSTATNMSTSLSNCSTCDAGSYCHGHGACVVQHDGNELSASCQCHFGYSASDRCDLPLYYIFISSGALTVMIVVLLSYVFIKYRQKKKAELEKARLLRTSRQEIAELSNAWLINPEEITFKQRIDKEFPGSFGQVHLAEYRGFQVAVKKLDMTLGMADSHLFERELETMRTIRHPNIVLFLGGGHIKLDRESRPVPFIVMEYMGRGTLRQILADSTVSVDHAQQLRFAVDIAKGLRFLHGLAPPRVHRDLKSTNLLVSDRWVVKVSDFGSAARFDVSVQHSPTSPTRGRSTGSTGDRSDLDLARADSLLHSTAVDESTPLLHSQAPLSSRVGTVAWSAPELLSRLSYGASVDVYSFGIVLWEICTRSVPFEEYPFTSNVRDAVLAGVRPPVPASCSNEYSTLMQQCWNGDHRQRPTFAAIVPDLDEQLERSLSSRLESHRTSASPSPGRPSSVLTIQ